MAIGAMKGLKSKRFDPLPQIYPLRVSMNLDVSRYCDPPLTTRAQPAEKIGERSAVLFVFNY